MTYRLGAEVLRTAELIRHRIVHQPEILNTNIQTTSICIQSNNLEVLVSVVYKPPNAVLTTNDLDLLTLSTDWQNSAEDFNSKHPLWHSLSTNAAGKVLYNYIQQSNYFVSAPTSPTHFSNNHRPDILDIALVRIPFPTQITNSRSITILSFSKFPVLQFLHPLPELANSLTGINLTIFSQT